MKKIDITIIVADVIAAMLCAVGSGWGAPFFACSSLIGVCDGARHKALSATIVNGIFLALNLFNCGKSVYQFFV